MDWGVGRDRRQIRSILRVLYWSCETLFPYNGIMVVRGNNRFIESKDTIWDKTETQTSHTRTDCRMFHYLYVTGCMWSYSVGSTWNNKIVNVELSEQVSNGPSSSVWSCTHTHAHFALLPTFFLPHLSLLFPPIISPPTLPLSQITLHWDWLFLFRSVSLIHLFFLFHLFHFCPPLTPH